MVIVDASVAVKWVVDEPDAQAAEALLEERLAAPSLWLAEATNALWSKCRRQGLTEQDVLDGCQTLARGPVTKIELELCCHRPRSSPFRSGTPCMIASTLPQRSYTTRS